MPQKKKALCLSIPEPCGENFDKMIPVKGGRFCDACEKTIVDFREMSDGQILHFYKKNNGKICGVFNKVQLNRAIPFPIERTLSRNWKAIAALASGLLFSGGMAAQTLTPPTVGKVLQVEHSMIEGETVAQEEDTTPYKVLKGQVKDQHLKESLIGVNILVKGTNTGTVSDLEGNFELTIPDGLTAFELEISYIGYETQTLFFNEKYPFPDRKIEIDLVNQIVPGKVMIMGIIAYDAPVTKVCEIPIESEEIENIPELKPDFEIESPQFIDNQITVFPNPFISNFKVAYDYAAKGDYLFHLYDVNGRLIFAKSYNLLKGKQTIELDIATQNVVDGVYILQISDNQDRILATKKVYKGRA